MKVKNLLVLGLIIMVLQFLVFIPAALSESREITVGTYGGITGDHSKICHSDTFEKKYGVRVNMFRAGGMELFSKMRIQKARPEMDVVFLSTDFILNLAINEGLIDKLNLENIPNINKLYPRYVTKDRYGVVGWIVVTGLAYNMKYVTSPPSWKDLWNPKYKGKISLADLERTVGWHTLVMAAKINGGDERNIDPGFEAIKKLRGNVLTFYTGADQVSTLIERGEVWIAPHLSDRAMGAAKRGLPINFCIPEEGGIGLDTYLVIVKGSKNKEMAEKYINHFLDTEAQGCFAQEDFSGPTNREVVLDPKLAKTVFPYGEEQIRKLYYPDGQYVSENRGKWVERWNKEITR